jgi:hypothetical protein
VVSGKEEINGLTMEHRFWIWKEKDMAWFQALSHDLSGWTEYKSDIPQLDYPLFQPRCKIGKLENKSEVLPHVPASGRT